MAPPNPVEQITQSAADIELLGRLGLRQAYRQTGRKKSGADIKIVIKFHPIGFGGGSGR